MCLYSAMVTGHLSSCIANMLWMCMLPNTHCCTRSYAMVDQMNPCQLELSMVLIIKCANHVCLQLQWCIQAHSRCCRDCLHSAICRHICRTNELIFKCLVAVTWLCYGCWCCHAMVPVTADSIHVHLKDVCHRVDHWNKPFYGLMCEKWQVLVHFSDQSV